MKQLMSDDVLEGIVEFVDEILLEREEINLKELYWIVASEYEVECDEVLKKRVRAALTYLKKENKATNPRKRIWKSI